MTFTNALSQAGHAENGLEFLYLLWARRLNPFDLGQIARLSLSSIFLPALKMHLTFKIWLLIFLGQRLRGKIEAGERVPAERGGTEMIEVKLSEE